MQVLTHPRFAARAADHQAAQASAEAGVQPRDEAAPAQRPGDAAALVADRARADRERRSLRAAADGVLAAARALDGLALGGVVGSDSRDAWIAVFGGGLRRAAPRLIAAADDPDVDDLIRVRVRRALDALPTILALLEAAC